MIYLTYLKTLLLAFVIILSVISFMGLCLGLYTSGVNYLIDKYFDYLKNW